MKFVLSVAFMICILCQSSFATTESDMTNFIIIGDTGKQTRAQREVANSVKKYCELSNNSCDAAFLLGDIVYDAGVSSANDPILDIVFKDYYQDLNFPFYAVLGNHDYGKLTRSLKRANYQLEYSKKNPQFIMPARFYYKIYKHAVVAFLDTTRLMWKKDVRIQESLIAEAKKIAAEKNLWFVVAGHHPYLSNGDHGNAGKYDRVKIPYFVSGKYIKKFINKNVCPYADLYISGHDHNLQMIDGKQAGCDSYLVVSGAGGSSGELSPRNKLDFGSTYPGYFHFEFNQKTLSIKAVNEMAEETYSKTLSRE